MVGRPEPTAGQTPPAPRRGHPRQTKPSAALRGVAGGRRRSPGGGLGGGGGPPRSMRAHTRAAPTMPRARTGRPTAQGIHGACAPQARPRPPGAPEPQRREPQSPGASPQLPAGCPPPGERDAGREGGAHPGKSDSPRVATHARFPRPGTSSPGFPARRGGRGGA